MTKETIRTELVELRQAYGMTHEQFAVVLTEHFAARDSHDRKSVVTTQRLQDWESGKGPANRPRALLEPVLTLFREAVAGRG